MVSYMCICFLSMKLKVCKLSFTDVGMGASVAGCVVQKIFHEARVTKNWELCKTKTSLTLVLPHFFSRSPSFFHSSLTTEGLEQAKQKQDQFSFAYVITTLFQSKEKWGYTE